jgi:CHAT domain-containing protein
MVGTGLPDEVIGLPTGLLQAGAAAVIGSLWSVDDLATAVLLARFYRLWRQDGLEMSEALRQAQRWMRDLTAEERNNTLPGIFPDGGAPAARPYSHPFFWAAFQFNGA